MHGEENVSRIQIDRDIPARGRREIEYDSGSEAVHRFYPHERTWQMSALSFGSALGHSDQGVLTTLATSPGLDPGHHSQAIRALPRLRPILAPLPGDEMDFAGCQNEIYLDGLGDHLSSSRSRARGSRSGPGR